MAQLNYHHLQYFQVVAHEGHLTRAARRLRISQSALSSQIRQLEERLGQPLFDRRGRALHLTEAGRIALDHADTIFATGDELLATLQQTGRTRQALRVGALATLSRNFQLAFLRPVLDRTDVEVVLRAGGAGELFDALSTLQLDVVLTNAPPRLDALHPFITHRLAEQPVSLIGVPARVGGEQPLASRLATAPLLLPTRSSGLRTAFEAVLSQYDIRPQIAAEIDDMAMLRLLTREGIGLAVIPPIVVRDELDSGELLEADRLPAMSETFYAVTTERRFPNPLLREVLPG
ncbi:LysR family transcriptional regulator [Spiribacter vilamensis]|uniref:LysR family transcriptional regulator n=1 Tax=Spiribacter vilamensis TaxID=531306 RepID=A0A4Q8D1Y1_9GAMM|nr:LysR family transcriptional regulator [Spiribacter vilamensis]RZU99378.1 LysR family transcriptional regulator [Spiribacter vilamensis]TVO61643.1 LysR family transcriptional regulator [Spiribacter vilamensis]